MAAAETAAPRKKKHMKPDLMIVAHEGGKGDHAEPDEDDREQCVPVSALSMPDDQEQMANPEVGDVVTYQVEGKVTRVEGDEAYVQPTSINGHELESQEEEQQEPTEDEKDQAEYSDLQNMAQQQGPM